MVTAPPTRIDTVVIAIDNHSNCWCYFGRLGLEATYGGCPLLVPTVSAKRDTPRLILQTIWSHPNSYTHVQIYKYIYIYINHPNNVTFTMKAWRFPSAMVHYWKVYPLVAHESNSLLGFQCFKSSRVLNPFSSTAQGGGGSFKNRKPIG